MLKNIRVIDLTMHLSGPYCCWLLASLGADVIKVERPDGDPTRETGPFTHGESTYFGSVNRNKRSIVIDLKSEEGKQQFTELIKTADVLVENFRAGVLARLGFSSEKLKTLNPKLILASITGFGQEGSLAHRPAFDVVIQGMSGMMSITGQRDGEPTAVGVSISDVSSGVFAALAVVAALFKRERTGQSSRVDIAMLHCQLALLENAVGRYLNAGEIARREGSRHPKVTPFQAYPTQDGTIVVAADGERNWQAMCKALDLEVLIHDPRFADNTARIEHYDELEQLLLPAFRSRTAGQALELLLKHDVPCGPVNTIPQILSSGYIKERPVISTVKRYDGVQFKYIASPVAAGCAHQELAAPALGQHTDEILRELGLRAQREAG
ncbi:MAG: CoA transferase [Candidimonas sp.]|nr:MAG: CoA transferase [Candidimonas sp.]TAM25732.1 MAG: CoA transferase [Candidimonas sp.]TAM75344.1 MAG: CoA transferase [Candidimonas sp.]